MFIKVQLYAILNNEIRLGGMSLDELYNEDLEPSLHVFRFRQRESDGSESKELTYLHNRIKNRIRNNHPISWEQALKMLEGRWLNLSKHYLL